LLDQAIANLDFAWERFEAATRQLTVPERIWHLLTHRAFNFNGVTAVRAEDHWQVRVASAVESGRPIEIAYPLICKINNPAKRLTTVNVTAGERATVRFFRELGKRVESIYPPGINIHVLSDATLYNSALQVPPPSAYAYMDAFRELILEESAARYVDMHDYAALLAPFAREFERSYNTYYQEMELHPESMLDSDSLSSLPTSVRSSINTRRMGLSYKQMQQLFGPDQTRFLPLRADIDNQTMLALREQLAIKMACDQLNLPERLWPNYIRASCHRGVKSGRAVLGLRCYPEYYGSSKLLPYHGMPLVEPDSRGRVRLIVQPEISLRGREDLIRVVNADQDPVLYVHRAVAVSVP
jgi:pyoverdine/dityrosine biosynthesis protein Dit1